MKSFRLIALLVIFAFAHQSYAQSITYKDLIGVWEKVEAKKGKPAFQFIDSNHVNIISSKGAITNASFKLNRQGEQVKMTIESNSEGVTLSDQYIIRFVDAETLRMENLNTYDPVVLVKPIETTMLLIKRKS